ncbi:uncharacterized protein Smp_202780 [Schistosoma mansoni]|uniref:uncharacterized protein n=1 Tax=Schistosoma mansoni TaxID=6183 RepID=UPI00022DC59E|nr:uncharacterized protein Smp_202780 [Schistosoma mansoni]|eukprot:XP_018652578.1 uncharacterized protein Smp_202780 [Schistosoma mansoni]
MKRLDIHSDLNAFKDYMERFGIWAITKEDSEDFNVVVHFLTFVVTCFSRQERDWYCSCK